VPTVVDATGAGNEHGLWWPCYCAYFVTTQRAIQQRACFVVPRFDAGDYRDFNVGIGFSRTLSECFMAAIGSPGKGGATYAAALVALAAQERSGRIVPDRLARVDRAPMAKPPAKAGLA
jgi:hypothetical protein